MRLHRVLLLGAAVVALGGAAVGFPLASFAASAPASPVVTSSTATATSATGRATTTTTVAAAPSQTTVSTSTTSAPPAPSTQVPAASPGVTPDAAPLCSVYGSTYRYAAYLLTYAGYTNCGSTVQAAIEVEVCEQAYDFNSETWVTYGGTCELNPSNTRSNEAYVSAITYSACSAGGLYRAWLWGYAKSYSGQTWAAVNYSQDENCPTS